MSGFYIPVGAVTMYALSLSKQILVAPGSLQRWQWGKVLGLWLATVVLVLFTLGARWPLLFALALHVFVDFTCQSAETAQGKARHDWRVLLIHGAIAGGWPVILLGPAAVVTSAALHVMIDATGKFGLKGPWGLVADQFSHLVALALIVRLYG